MPLTTKQRKHLQALAHELDPVVRIGKGRISDPVAAETVRSLEAHELIKVRIEADDGDVRRDLAAELADLTGSELVGTIGKIAILYREREEDPSIRLPRVDIVQT
ncbi:MAG: ribosome assembly RNA-binding protein YhbY [Thermoanaerobaculia bacterium]